MICFAPSSLSLHHPRPRLNRFIGACVLLVTFRSSANHFHEFCQRDAEQKEV